MSKKSVTKKILLWLGITCIAFIINSCCQKEKEKEIIKTIVVYDTVTVPIKIYDTNYIITETSGIIINSDGTNKIIKGNLNGVKIIHNFEKMQIIIEGDTITRIMKLDTNKSIIKQKLQEL